MKNLIYALALTVIAVTLTSSIALANDYSTSAIIDTNSVNPPIVKAVWIAEDQNPDKPWTQIMLPVTVRENTTMTYWVIATDPYGPNFLSDPAYVDVYHPDGSFKYQVPLSNQPFDCSLSPQDTRLTTILAAIDDANSKGLIKLNSGYTVDDLKHELIKCSAKAYKGTATLHYCQPYGEFQWTRSGCPDCTWQVNSFTGGYSVVPFAYDTIGGKSDNTPVLYFEYVKSVGIELDFNALNFGHVLMSNNKWIEGNDPFDSFVCRGTPTACASQTSQSTCTAITGCTWGGTACAADVTGVANCRFPTVRNIGNVPAQIDVTFDDAGLKYSTLPDGSKSWNVQWDGRLGTGNDVTMNPYEKKTLPDGPLGLCTTNEISFSMHVIKPTATQASGTVTIEAYASSG